MSDTARILVLAGSAAASSLNRRLARAAAAAVEAAGGAATTFELRDHPLPLYDRDLEAREGLHPHALLLKEALRTHHGLLLACPEHNGAVSAALKNAIDWASRRAGTEGPLASFDGKVAALVSASPGALGGLRGLASVRAILGSIRVIVIPEQLAVGKAHEAFDEDGGLRDPAQRASLDRLAASLVRVAGAVGAAGA